LAPDVHTDGDTTPDQQIVWDREVTTSGFWYMFALTLPRQ
jgi:hypothetical protein